VLKIATPAPVAMSICTRGLDSIRTWCNHIDYIGANKIGASASYFNLYFFTRNTVAHKDDSFLTRFTFVASDEVSAVGNFLYVNAQTLAYLQAYFRL
jgi:hypothetical protein